MSRKCRFAYCVLLVMPLVLILTGCNLGQAPTDAPPLDETDQNIPDIVAAPTDTATVITIAPRATDTPVATPTPIVTLPGGCVAPDGWFPYQVKRGDTLNRLATRSNSTLRDLIQGNCLQNPDVIPVGRWLYLPADLIPTVPPTHTPTPTIAPIPIQFYLIAPQDAGAIGTPVGCQDQLVAVKSERVAVSRPADDVRNALGLLFLAGHDASVDTGGLTNALYESPLSVREVRLRGRTLEVTLTGSFRLSGLCEDVRQEWQVLATIFQFAGFDVAEIYVISGEETRNMKQIFDLSGFVPDDANYTRAEVDSLTKLVVPSS